MADLNRINFLCEASKMLPPISRTHQLLKSHYLTICRDTAKTKINLPKSEFGEQAMCPKCSSCWYDGNFRFRVTPKRVDSLKGNKLVESLNSGKVLTKRQKVRAKWFGKRINSFVEITCLLCKNKTKLGLEKPPKSNEYTHTTFDETPAEVNTKKKKKKKDKFAGLNASILQSIKKDVPNKSVELNKKPVKAVPKIQFNEKKILNISLNIKKPSTKQPEKSKKNQPSKVEVVKQKKKLLQLAQILKKNENRQKSSTNDRLEILLR